jgi:hypothetical protein
MLMNFNIPQIHFPYIESLKYTTFYLNSISLQFFASLQLQFFSQQNDQTNCTENIYRKYKNLNFLHDRFSKQRENYTVWTASMRFFTYARKQFTKTTKWTGFVLNFKYCSVGIFEIDWELRIYWYWVLWICFFKYFRKIGQTYLNDIHLKLYKPIIPNGMLNNFNKQVL